MGGAGRGGARRGEEGENEHREREMAALAVRGTMACAVGSAREEKTYMERPGAPWTRLRILNRRRLNGACG